MSSSFSDDPNQDHNSEIITVFPSLNEPASSFTDNPIRKPPPPKRSTTPLPCGSIPILSSGFTPGLEMGVPVNNDFSSFVQNLKMLRGSDANLAQCVALGIISLFCCFMSIWVVSAKAGSTAAPFIAVYVITIIILGTSILSVSKGVRDRRMGSLFHNEMLATQLIGTSASQVMAGLSFASSLVLTVATSIICSTMNPDALTSISESVLVLMMSISFFFTSLINLSNIWRDRFDAIFYEYVVEHSPLRLQEVNKAVQVNVGTKLNYYINLLAALLSTAAIIGTISITQKIEVTQKILLILSELFMISSAINASKLVRDLAEEGTVPPTRSWKIITALSVIISLVSVFGVTGVICRNNPVEPRLCAILIIGSFWVLGSIITVSKITRDRDERKRFFDKHAAENAAVSHTTQVWHVNQG